MFKRKSPLQHWDESPSLLGWSVLDGELVEARGIRKGKRLQLRLTRDGSFPFPDGPSLSDQVDLAHEGRWVIVAPVVDAVSGGTRVATTMFEALGMWSLHGRHAELICYRIAHGMLYPDDELLETLSGVQAVKEKLDRIDLERIRRKVPSDRVPTEDELMETGGVFLNRELRFDAIAEIGGLKDASDEEVSAGVESLKRLLELHPFKLDGAPYLK